MMEPELVRELDKINTRMDRYDASSVALAIAMARIEATLIGLQSLSRSETLHLQESGRTATESNWKWIATLISLVSLFAGVIYAILHH